jgi:hypothetical protein
MPVMNISQARMNLSDSDGKNYHSTRMCGLQAGLAYFMKRPDGDLQLFPLFRTPVSLLPTVTNIPSHVDHFHPLLFASSCTFKHSSGVRYRWQSTPCMDVSCLCLAIWTTSLIVITATQPRNPWHMYQSQTLKG